MTIAFTDPPADIGSAAEWYARITSRLPYPDDAVDMRRFASWVTRRWLEPLGAAWESVLPYSPFFGAYLPGPEYVVPRTSKKNPYALRPCVINHARNPLVGVLRTDLLDARYVSPHYRYQVMWQCLDAGDARLCFPGLLEVVAQLDCVCLAAELACQ